MAIDYKAEAGSDNEKYILGFTVDELRLNYTEWTQLTSQRRRSLSPDIKKWLYAWEMLDLHNSPMNDEHRSQIRYGHYLGWFSSIESD